MSSSSSQDYNALKDTEVEATNTDLSLFRDFDNPEAIQLHLDRDFNLASYLLEACLEKWADRVAIVAEGKVLTFSQLERLTNQAGNFLKSCGVAIEQRVLLRLEDPTLLIPMFLGAIKIGAVPVPVHHDFHLHELRYVVKDSRAVLAAVDPDHLPAFADAAESSPWLKTLVLSAPISTSQLKSLPEELQYASGDLNAAATTLDDTAFWVYTQGITGFPKATIHMHHAPIYCCRAFADEVLHLSEEDVLMSTLSLNGSQGLVNTIFFPLWSGATSVIPSHKATAKELLELIATHSPSVFFSTPNIFEEILQEVENKEKRLFPSLRCCISTGQILTPTTAANWKKQFEVELTGGLSCTEALYIFLSNTPGSSRAGSIGKAVPGYRLRLENKSGRLTDPGEVGNLYVIGGSIANGYWNKHKKTCRTLVGPWLDTGDKCMRDEEGYYYFTGRSEDMIYIHNQWISPTEVEEHLRCLPQVAQVAIVSALDESESTRLRAYIVLKPNLEPSVELANEIRINANKNQPIHYQIKWIEFVPDLPHSTNGRIQRYKLR